MPVVCPHIGYLCIHGRKCVMHGNNDFYVKQKAQIKRSIKFIHLQSWMQSGKKKNIDETMYITTG